MTNIRTILSGPLSKLRTAVHDRLVIRKFSIVLGRQLTIVSRKMKKNISDYQRFNFMNDLLGYVQK